MDNCLTLKDLDRLIDCHTPPARLAGIKRHLRLCDACAARLVQRRISPDLTATPSIKGPTQIQNHPPTLVTGLEPNMLIGDFRIERRLGMGGMGIVYLAHQISLNRAVALKVLPINPLTSPSVIERFHREAQAVAKLRHPNIVAIYEERVEQNLCYYTMEWVDGQSLDRTILEFPKRTGLTKSLGRTYYDGHAHIVATLGNALHYAHRQGVIHRDIKPSNIMLTRDGRPMLLDFGIARLLDDPGITLTSTFLGTPLYMSPEQIGARSGEVDARSDIYSLGATLYELITGHVLYENLKSREKIVAHMLRRPPKRPRQIDNHIPVDLETICLKALEFNPAERYASAGDMAEDLKRFLNRQVIMAKPAGPLKRLNKCILRHKAVSALFLVVLIAAGVAVFMTVQDAQNRKIRQLLPQLENSVNQNAFFQAYLLTRELKGLMPTDPVLAEIEPQITHEYDIVTLPTTARVQMQDYFNPDSPWIPLGTTPIGRIRLPYGVNRFRVQSPGYLPLEVALVNKKLPLHPTLHQEGHPKRHIAWTLHKPEQIPEQMVWIPTENPSEYYLFHKSYTIETLPPFCMDKYEVTNRDYQAFVDAGGYREPAYWPKTFTRDGRSLNLDQARALWVDQTGYPGPVTWKNGTYSPGQDRYPVSGVSWYEAAAYAAYRGKNLPTVFHWLWASSANDTNAKVMAHSNFSGKIAPVGSYRGMGRYGLYDAAGNVREWCTNVVQDEEVKRSLMGGTYNSPRYVFRYGYSASPWDRSAYNGFRCMQDTNGTEPISPTALQPLEYLVRDWGRFRPHTPEEFENYQQTLYAYERKPLQAVIENVDYEVEICRREQVTFDAAYSDERVVAYIHLPLNAQPPYQTVVWYPASEAGRISWEQYCQNYHRILEVLMRAGRAVVIPIYKNIYDRRIDTSSWEPFGLQNRNLQVQQTQDLARTLDYLETRADIDPNQIAYMGYGWGASIAPRMLAYEDRVRTAVLLYGALCACSEKAHPSVDHARFAPFLKIPALLINGRDSIIQPYETDQKPLYDLLGTPEEEKAFIHFPGGHTLPWEYHRPHDQAILEWLDRYLGPVRTTVP